MDSIEQEVTHRCNSFLYEEGFSKRDTITNIYNIDDGKTLEQLSYDVTVVGVRFLFSTYYSHSNDKVDAWEKFLEHEFFAADYFNLGGQSTLDNTNEMLAIEEGFRRARLDIADESKN